MKLPRAAWILVIVHLLLTGFFALVQPHLHLLDDAYYTLTVARHIADGQGITYGGAPTNGFQPLYGFVMAPVMWLFGGHPEWCLRLAKLFLAFCSAALLVVLMKVARRLLDDGAAWLVGLLFVANANLLGHSLSGLETSLHALLFWLFVYLYLQFRDDERTKVLVALGLLLGLTAYARFDTVFLMAGVAVDIVWRKRREPRAVLGRGFLMFTPAALLLAPWFVWSRFACGSFFQSSGAFHRWRGLLQQGVPESWPGMIKFAAVKWISLGIKLPLEPLFGYERAMRVLAARLLSGERQTSGFLVQLGRDRPLIAVALVALALAIAALLFWFGRRHVGRIKKLEPLAFLLVPLAGAAVFYPLYMLNYSMRHFYALSLGVALIWAAFFSGFLTADRLAGNARRVAAGALLVFLLALPGLKDWTADHTPRDAWRLIDTIEKNVPTGSRIGYTDCGVFGFYLLDFEVVNLDGILNFEALHAMRDGDIGAYLIEHDVPYVLHLHNFQADYATQWQTQVAPRAVPLLDVDWIYRLKIVPDAP
ncbi:MAG: glycosyltransferase family 39 protein [Candidatus Lernaella stagnicola]|nr:glycosyltransferase family 39 protein [Candidatus Lernaella stagnicola]